MRKTVGGLAALVDPLVAFDRILGQLLNVHSEVDGASLGLLRNHGVIRWERSAGELDVGVDAIPMSLRRLALEAVAAETPIVWCDRESEGAAQCGPRQSALTSVLLLPLHNGGCPVGVAMITSSRPEVFEPDVVATYRRLSPFISSVVSAASEQASAVAALRTDSPCGFRETEARFVAEVLAPGAASGCDARSQILRAINCGRISVRYQPIIDLRDHSWRGVEALARFDGPPDWTTEQWFEIAHRYGVGIELELATIRLALADLDQLPGDVYLGVNMSPQVALDKRAFRLLAPHAARVVVEITEHDSIQDYERLRRHLQPLRQLGAKLAVDDTGSGFASLTHILELRPDLIKLDRALSEQIDSDPIRRCLAQSLVRFAAEIDTVVIAEGIETPSQLGCLSEMGIDYGQGFLLAPPSHITSIATAPSQGAAPMP